MQLDSYCTSGSSPTPAVDFILENHGSILLLHPQNLNAVAWLNENIGQDNGFQPYWPTAVVEARYAAAIVEGMIVDGLALGAA
jgi:hypothetical protein